MFTFLRAIQKQIEPGPPSLSLSQCFPHGICVCMTVCAGVYEKSVYGVRHTQGLCQRNMNYLLLLMNQYFLIK